MSAIMSPRAGSWTPIAAAVLVVSGALSPGVARADLHNITYIARIDGVAPGSQASFVVNGGQTQSTPLSSMPGQVFEANEVLPDPHQAGMRVSMQWPYSANVHCEIDVDNAVVTQVDRVVSPKQGNSDPSSGVLSCGAPLPG